MNAPGVHQAANAANLALSGKINSTGTVLLTDDNVATTTVVTNYFMGGPESMVLFDPVDAVAATELASGSMHVLEANRATGSFTITHTASASVREFRYAILG